MKRNDEERQLTKAEMEIMNVLWNAKGMTTHEIIEEYPEPKPAYSTIATFLKILEQKGFVERRKSGTGKVMVYSPLMTRERYRRLVMDDVKRTFFGGSVASLVSFFAEEDELTQEDIEEIRCILQKKEKKTGV